MADAQPVVAVTVAAYLAAVVYLQPVYSSSEEGTGWMSYGDVRALKIIFVPVEPYPELVIVAGAVLAHARLDRVRPWHVLAIVGLLGSLWHHGALALLVAAVVVGAYDLNARRPGAWYPLLLVGIGLVVWPVVDRVVLAPELPLVPANAPGGRNEAGGISGVVLVAGGPWRDYDQLFPAIVVAVGLAVWSWRRRSPIMLLTAVVYAGLTWLRPMFVEKDLVVLAGAAVAFATTAAPGATRTAGRSAGTPDRPPGL